VYPAERLVVAGTILCVIARLNSMAKDVCEGNAEMKIAIIGTGNIGGGLGRLWLAHGHEVIFGVRDEGKVEETRKTFAGAEAAGIRETVANADLVLIAVPWPAMGEVLGELGQTGGKVLVDATNPLKKDLSGLEALDGTSAAEMVQNAHPDARVVKAFNSLGAAFLGHGEVGGGVADGFYCGDDEDAKRMVAKLIEQAGLKPADCGPLRNARYLEAMAMLWIDMAFGSRRGERFAFKLLSDAKA
jgi:hypothetical protein